MAGLLNIISKLFGNKYDKDVKEITPIITQINAEFSKLSTLTNDELRTKTSDFKKQIADFIASEKQTIATLKTEANNSATPTEKKELLDICVSATKEMFPNGFDQEQVFTVLVNPVYKTSIPYSSAQTIA